MKEVRKKRVVVGVTGVFGSGKSTASSFFPKTWKKVDVDVIGHTLLLKKEIKKRIIKNFGKEIVKNGTIDRKKLGAVVFSNPKKLILLNKIMHPLLKKAVQREIKKSKKNIVIDCALLRQLQLEKRMDFIILVTAPVKLRKQRLQTRFSKKGIEQRWNKQKQPQNPDIIIMNTGSKKELEKNMRKLSKFVMSYCQKNNSKS